MGKKKKQEKQKKKHSAEEKALLKEKKKAEKASQASEDPTAEKKPPVLLDTEAVQVFRALGDETRMEILSLLKEQELCAQELLLQVKIVQSTLSHHMKILTESGLVACRRENKRIYYSISAGQMEAAEAFLRYYHLQ